MGVSLSNDHVGIYLPIDWTIGTHKRGVIVYVYAYNNNNEELKALENGSLGYYYN
jgi:hypothetical protein